MSHPTVKAARIRFHCPDLDCDVSRRIGWSARFPDGTRGKVRRTRDEAKDDLRGEKDGRSD